MKREVNEELGEEDMNLNEFLHAVRDGFYTDDDGIAILYSEETSYRDEQIKLLPSQFGTLRVVWLNK